MPRPREAQMSTRGPVFVLYPRGWRTGGPEALHQLVHSLRSHGRPAFLVPLPGTRDSQRVAQYESYDAPERNEVDDEPGSVVVAPETAITELSRLHHATKVAWWLSIDNSPIFETERRIVYLDAEQQGPPLKRFARRAKAAVKEWSYRGRPWHSMFHLAQCHYAWSYLYSRLDITPSLLTDYTPLEQIDAAAKTRLSQRGLTIAYNPSKGGRLVEELQRRGLPYEFRPIAGMTRKEVVSTLCDSAVYLDLGHHPGKDRMPREAAVAGAVVLVARRGAAANSRDMPIPWEHKIDVSADPLAQTERRLEHVFGDLGTEKLRQDTYETFIRGERGRFDSEVAAFFEESKYGSDLDGDRLPRID